MHNTHNERLNSEGTFDGTLIQKPEQYTQVMKGSKIKLFQTQYLTLMFTSITLEEIKYTQ